MNGDKEVSESPVKARTSGLAIASLILGICGLPFAVVGLIFGIVALHRINKSGGELKGRGLAIAGIVVSSVIIVLVWTSLVFRLGEYTYRGKEAGIADKMEKLGTAEKTLTDNGKAELTKSTGNNVIVLVEYKRQADLEPVQAHFAGHDIATEIVKNWDGRYFLITKDRYDNLSTPGTEGYKALQRIVEVGAKYKGKVPEGFETFAPDYFKDAYGRKVN